MPAPRYIPRSQRGVPSVDTSTGVPNIQPTEDLNEGWLHWGKRKIDDFIIRHASELRGEKSGILNPNPQENPLIDKPLLPEMKDQSGLIGKAAKFGYDNIVRPMSSPLGITGSALGSHPADLSLEATGVIPKPKAEVKIPSSLPMPEVYAKPSLEPRVKPRLALPPAKPEPPKPSFLVGEKGITVPGNVPNAEVIAAYGSKSGEGTIPSGEVLNPKGFDPGEVREANRLAKVTYGPGAQGGVVSSGRNAITERERIPTDSMDVAEPKLPMPPTSGDTRLGFQEQTNPTESLGYPLDVVPNRLRPRATQTETIRNVPEVYQPVVESKLKPATTTNLSDAPVPTYEKLPVVEPEMQPRRVSAIDKRHAENAKIPNRGPSSVIPPDKRGKVKLTPGSTEGVIPGSKASVAKGKILSTADSTDTKKPYSGTIPVDASPKTALGIWANKLKASVSRGSLNERAFSDLKPGLKEIHDYQSGVRNDSTKRVEKLLNDMYESEVKAGVLKEGQKKPNYLRQYWEQSPEEVSTAISNYIAKNPKFAKKSSFETYAQGIESGLKPKYENMSEIIGARTREGHRALANQELRDWLIETKQLKPGQVLNDNPHGWDLIGPNKDAIKGYIKRTLDDSQSPPVKAFADFSSWSKNISLAGGVPFTKWNMHGLNTAKSMAKLHGYRRAVTEFINDPTGKQAGELLNHLSKTRGKDLGDLADNGFNINVIGDKTADLHYSSNIINKGAEIFEKPLFERSLPALSQQHTLDVLDRLIAEGMPREKALTAAAEIGNDFSGSVTKSVFGNKNLRSATAKDASRIIFLAPDWLESRVNLALKEYKALGKGMLSKVGITEKLNPAEKFYARSGARGAALGAGIIGGKLLSNTMNSKPGDVLNVPLGQDTTGKNRQLAFGTADEGVRVPVQVAVKAALQRDPMPLLDLMVKNKMSTTAQSITELVTGHDSFGNAIRGQDKYGADISLGKSIYNHLRTLTKPMQYQLIQALLKYGSGDSSLEEVASTALELPVAYHTPGSSNNESGSRGRTNRNSNRGRSR